VEGEKQEKMVREEKVFPLESSYHESKKFGGLKAFRKDAHLLGRDVRWPHFQKRSTGTF
jgi:hypothetical protein